MLIVKENEAAPLVKDVVNGFTMVKVFEAVVQVPGLFVIPPVPLETVQVLAPNVIDAGN